MAARNHKIRTFLTPGKKVHLVGIGGVSMRPLGLVLQGMGIQVTGSDMPASVSPAELRAHGIQVFIGHSAKNIQGADCIIRTAAAHNDNPEIAAARAVGIPVFERAEAWGVLMQSYENAICISGTHGKTTTTSMVTHILLAAQQDPTVMIGGYLPILHAGHRVGKGDSIVLESCEYCDSFLNFFPTLAVVLNVEADHLDYFHDLADIQKSFRKFAQLVPKGTGRVLANGDDPNTMEALKGLELTTFGLGVYFFVGNGVKAVSWPVMNDYENIKNGFADLAIPGLSQIPVIGNGLFSHNMLVYLAVVIALVMWWYMNRTTPGLRLRAVGENPGAADSVGINVKWYKYLHICLGCGIMGIGGYYMSLNMSGSFNSSCWINGYGWIAVALVIFANWNPLYAILGTLVFGFFNTLQIYSGSLAGAFPDALGWLNSIPSHLFKALPFLITAIVLVVTSIRKREGSGQPAALGLNYFREER